MRARSVLFLPASNPRAIHMTLAEIVPTLAKLVALLAGVGT